MSKSAGMSGFSGPMKNASGGALPTRAAPIAGWIRNRVAMSLPPQDVVKEREQARAILRADLSVGRHRHARIDPRVALRVGFDAHSAVRRAQYDGRLIEDVEAYRAVAAIAVPVEERQQLLVKGIPPRPCRLARK